MDPIFKFNLILSFGNYLLILMYLGLTIAWWRKRREGLVHALLSSFAAWLVVSFIKEIFPTPRPFLQNGLMPTGFNPASGSFPSGHTAAAFAFGVSAFMHDGPVGVTMLVGSFLIAISRILGNVHYPVDIVGGAIIGAITARIVFRLHLPRKHLS
ncbi:hypothetical protein A2634_05365 [Candidatus Amesbacteria bacterium RIFCSPHIGHO2_01_FULL_48_32]|uniref:Phosphatidic acid phosphatase type 2/haloperoxidase domain-containing protein n=1 Tax=Candidatus Amesbacteria bacterium RIFCSPLOWO2_01_FULL_48_25 TaxID=1797259 RepID=A0A1F4ZF48_9BACT|nr:MAG: hypothetical protein A2634_05365 [Candidatus Amesbacteria bacterium RIFCSPHIGHO2_01_FULL_48_32]OGD04094.1 MAG: hypothetical protein A2989_01710 [Candidatus Amesbacteria bacterium RIFCSPLOWO2_01_FULL_48_25]HJZ05639.1 phosphatase PAP2 family protein [Patescibacteria group bacterium]